MADAAEVAIEAALLARARAFAVAQSLTIAEPGADFTPPAISKTAKYLRAHFMPDVDAPFMGFDDPNKHYGILQIDVMHGQGVGEIIPRRIAALVAAYFPRGAVLTRDGFRIDLTKAPRIVSAMKEDPWLKIPVRIEFCCFANPA